MAEIILKTFITFFVIYALIDISMRVFRHFFGSETRKSDVFVVIRVKNQEENLECIVRSVIWRFLSQNGGGKLPVILIVDVGSDDKTREISKRLCDDYHFIYYTTESKYNKMKKNLFL